ncbi:NAD(P)-dependent oxidoreductase [Streptomyces malaysiensis subsp. malaysiensis]|uniref:NAD(P)-dependent oxidoreductase n=1 Tax=Streptomyces malaysiensis TaxID=92644 RepID=UPI000BFCF92B|nr:NAD(P)-binding domain-containing protein [Streptomyces malaysiensis]QDL75235.1 NAD(P)-dependent oxidoreductase [Streptomyces malaysiensis]
MSETPVTVLGLGDMGTALARALVGAGHRTTVWNRTAAKAEALAAEGARTAATAGAAVAASPLVVVCLLDYDSVRQVLAPLGDALSGRAVVNLTNGTPRQARELAAWAAGHGAQYLDGGIMAVPPMIGTPAAFLLYSGSPAAFTAHRTVLDLFGESHHLGEDPGRAPLYDLALLSAMYGMFSGVLHGYALMRSDGVAAADAAPLMGRWLTAMSGVVDGYARQIDSGDHATGVVSNLAMQSAAFVNFTSSARDQGISPELIAPIGDLMARRVADGHGHEGLSGLVELLGPGRPGGAV